MSLHKRNTVGLYRATCQKKEAIIKRVNATLDEMSCQNKKITFHSVAHLAQVSKAWLYRNEKIRCKIDELRSQSMKSPQTNKSLILKETLIVKLRERIKKLENQNKELHKQLEVIYGEIHKNKIINHLSKS